MGARPDLERLVFDPSVPFDERALAVFRFQVEACAPYGRFCRALGASEPQSADDIPLMPIGLFKEIPVCCVPIAQVPMKFRSSATGGKRSTHWVAEPAMYHESVIRSFESFYPHGPRILWTYLPGYSDNPESSLVHMARILRGKFGAENCWEIPLDQPLKTIYIFEKSNGGQPVILLGAAFGLLDLIDAGIESKLPFDSVVIETGGMKTRRRERTREELHRELSEGFGVPLENIHSEYGMAELLSQAYSLGGPWYQTPHWMKISLRDPLYPLQALKDFQIDAMGPYLLGIKDLANLYSCSFLLSGDRGWVREDGAFQVLGRLDGTDLRGCNFMMERD